MHTFKVYVEREGNRQLVRFLSVLTVTGGLHDKVTWLDTEGEYVVLLVKGTKYDRQAWERNGYKVRDENFRMEGE